MISLRSGRGLALALAAALLLAIVAAPAPASAKTSKKSKSKSDVRREMSRGRVLMGTILTVTADAHDTSHVGRAIEDAFTEVAHLDSALSSWREDSELSSVNRAPAQTRVPVSADFYDALEQALQIAQETDAAFDPTIEPLNRVWDMRGEGRVPAPAEVAEARSRTGWHRVRLDPGAHTLWFQRDSMALDFGGIGKGIALDRIEKKLRDAGVERALINFGGEVLAISDGEGWTVRVAHPVERAVPAVKLAVRTCAVSTSAQSERGIDVRGVHYGHVLDPRSGYPVTTQASVTVVARSGARADGLSTALLVLGREEAKKFAETHPDVGVLWLEPDGAGLRAWRWNLSVASAAPGMHVEWIH